MQIDINSGIPVYLQIKAAIEQDIASRGLTEGAPLPTLQELCDQAHVSMRTAQRAVEALLDSGVARRMGRKLVVASGLVRPPRAKSVYVACFDFDVTVSVDWISARILAGIREALAELPEAELVVARPDFAGSLDFYLNNPSMRVEGAILCHCLKRDELEALALRYPTLRFVQTNYFFDDFESLPANVLGVFNDDFGGAYMGTEYLTDICKCRKPVFWELGSLDQAYQERRRGFLYCLRERGLEGRVFLQERFEKRPENLLGTHYNFFASLFRQAGDCDGIFACNDTMAAAAGMFLAERGLELPILGYDDFSDVSVARGSTLAIDYARMGKVAVHRLRTPEPRFTKLLPHLIVRRQLAMPLAEAEEYNIIELFEAP